ncbi:MAG: hypothetical protein Q9227_003134 [Pyrenula ochraceoflavens]
MSTGDECVICWIPFESISEPTLTELRQASLIVPQTGARIKKRITLRSLDGQDERASPADGSSHARTPLLGHRVAISQDHPSTVSRSWQKVTEKLRAFRTFAVSETGKGIFKCSIAYVLGSMATFVPFLANSLGQQNGKHMVATITVYFHPARSRGSMWEALICAFTAFVYAVFICVSSMSVSVFFTDVLDLMPLGHIIVLIVFAGGGLGIVGWVKQRKANPLVNISCSLTSLAIITILTKEGAVQRGDYSFAKIAQVLKMIIMGVVATMAVSFLIFPISAKQKLRQNMIDVTTSLADMLGSITSSFLEGSEAELEENAFKTAAERHKKAHGSLGKNLREAKFEHYVEGTEKQYEIEARLVHCVQRVTQSIGGLRSAASMQFGLLKQPTIDSSHFRPNGESKSAHTSASITPYAPYSVSRSSSVVGDFSRLSAIVEMSEEENSGGSPRRQDYMVQSPGHMEDEGSKRLESPSPDQNQSPGSPADTTQAQVSSKPLRRQESIFRSPAEIFELFITNLGPSMRSLAYTLKEILDDLPYDSSAEYDININPHFRSSLIEATKLYNSSRTEALKMVYDQKVPDKYRPMEVEADYEEVAASCGHFSFCLIEVADQIKDYLDALEELQLVVEERPNGRSWNWLKFWHSDPKSDHQTSPTDSDLDDQAENINVEVDLPETKERSRSSSQRSIRIPPKAKIGYKLWRFLRPLRREDVKFAIKVGVGAALYALPSFLASTRSFYSHWRGEWGLLSYMLVCSMTIGASNTTGWSRFTGTCLGAVMAILAWTVTNGNVFGMAMIGWAMAYWTAYIIVGLGKGPMGRFIMLTYNLSALYAYSLSVKDEDHDQDEGGSHPVIASIAGHRVVAVLSGVVWGLIFTRLVWPISARHKLKDGLSLIWLRMGLIWRRDPLSTFIEGDAPISYMNLREEFELQRYLGRLEKLRDSAQSEYDLRGPFPDKQYSIILQKTGRMLDAFHAMNVAIMKDNTASKGEATLLRYTLKERRQLSARISHLFSVLASSMKLQYPLNDALPNTEHTRDRLLARIFAYRKHEQSVEEVPDEDFGLLYAYALVTGQLSLEIREVLQEVEGLFGVLDEDLLKLE